MRARPRPRRLLRKKAARAQMKEEILAPVGPELRPHQIVLRPLITEKGTHQSTHEHHRAYAFKVSRHANKTQIKWAVQELFGVRVEAVRTQQHMGKKRRYRFRIGTMSNWKKAIVKLHPEDRIEFF
jgi:large subunit ribosomal protein L23